MNGFATFCQYSMLNLLLHKNNIYIFDVCAQSCPTLCDPMDCSSPGSSVHGISQARILEWVAIPFSRDLPDPRIKTEFLAAPVEGELPTIAPPGKSKSNIMWSLKHRIWGLSSWIFNFYDLQFYVNWNRLFSLSFKTLFFTYFLLNKKCLKIILDSYGGFELYSS